jgi:hypothetical protein
LCGHLPIGVNVTVSWLWGGSLRPVFFFFFRGFAAKKEEKRIFFGDCIPQTPALQSGKPLKLMHMGILPPPNGGCLLHAPRAQGKKRTLPRARLFWWGVWNVQLCQTFQTPHRVLPLNGGHHPARSMCNQINGGDLWVGCLHMAKNARSHMPQLCSGVCCFLDFVEKTTHPTRMGM